MMSMASAYNYMLKRWPQFAAFLKYGRICLSNNAAEQALRGIAWGRRSWPFAGSDRGSEDLRTCRSKYRGDRNTTRGPLTEATRWHYKMECR